MKTPINSAIRTFFTVFLLGWTGVCLLPLAKAAYPAFSPEMLKELQVRTSNRLHVQTLPIPEGIVYYAIVPPSYTVLPVVSEQLQTVDRFQSPLADKAPQVVINAGFFDPNNHQTISYVTVDGQLVADPTKNKGLTDNKNLKPYLPKIFNRSELRVYVCKASDTGIETQRFDIETHQAPLPVGCRLRHALGGGPLLLPQDRSREEAVVEYDAKGRLIRDPLGVKTQNARSLVGITNSGSLIILMVAQNPQAKAYGVNFSQMGSLIRSLGAVKAMGLDGGSSSSLVLSGKTYWGKFNKEAQPVKRPIKSVLMVLPPD